MEYRSAAPTQTTHSISPGIVLGLGLGGFIDGIALHQIVQWHNMGSAKVPPITMEAMQQNMAWDGWFHVATLVLTIFGVYLLLNHARARGYCRVRDHSPANRCLAGAHSTWSRTSTIIFLRSITSATCPRMCQSMTGCFSALAVSAAGHRLVARAVGGGASPAIRLNRLLLDQASGEFLLSRNAMIASKIFSTS